MFFFLHILVHLLFKFTCVVSIYPGSWFIFLALFRNTTLYTKCLFIILVHFLYLKYLLACFLSILKKMIYWESQKSVHFFITLFELKNIYLQDSRTMYFYLSQKPRHWILSSLHTLYYIILSFTVFSFFFNFLYYLSLALFMDSLS